MFSDHMPKIDRVSGRNLFFLAGGLIIACQLAAMGMVAGGQVKKAEIRESQLAAQRAAISQCFETNARAGRQECVLQASTTTNGDSQLTADSGTANALPRESGSYTNFTRGPSASVQAGVMAVSFAAR